MRVATYASLTLAGSLAMVGALAPPLRAQGTSDAGLQESIRLCEKVNWRNEHDRGKALRACHSALSSLESLPIGRLRNFQLAEVHRNLGSYERSHELTPAHLSMAENHYRAALHALRQTHDLHSVEVAFALYELASLYYQRHMDAEAETIARQSLEVRKKILGKNHLQIAQSLDLLAFSVYRQGKLPEAEAMFRQSIAMKKRWGFMRYAAIESLAFLADVLIRQERYVDAESLLREAYDITRKMHSLGHLSLLRRIDDLVFLLGRQKKTQEIGSWIDRMLSVAHTGSATRDPEVATLLNNTAAYLEDQGNYSESEKLFRVALGRRKTLLGKEHPQVAESINNLAVILSNQSKYEEAETLLRPLIDEIQKRPAKANLNMSTSLNNLANAVAHQGKYKEAEQLFQLALIYQKKQLGDKHPEIATQYNNFAFLLSEQGKLSEAETYYRHALRIREELLGKRHRDTATILNNLACVLLEQGKVEESSQLYHRALEIRHEMLGPQHPYVALTLTNLAGLYLTQKQSDAALPLLFRATTIREIQIRSAISEARIHALLSDLRGEEELVYGLLLSNADMPQFRLLAMSTALLRKGRVADSGAAANRLMHRSLGRAVVRQHFDRWQLLRQQREALLYTPSDKMDPKGYQDRQRQLQLEIDGIEHQLASELPSLRHVHPPEPRNIVPAVAGSLPQNGVLLEVIWTQSYQPQRAVGGTHWGAPHYIALLLFPNQRILSIDLGAAAEVDASAQAMLSVLRNPKADPTGAAQDLYKKLFHPILHQLAGVSELFLSLDGTLNLIPFDALHDGNDYLLGRYRFHYLTSGRDLLRKTSQQSSGPALVLGNPDFGKLDSRFSQAGNSNVYQRLSDLARLPGSQREVELLAPLLGTIPMLDRQAREEVVHEAHGPFVLHIATHGLFLSDIDLLPATEPERELRGFSASRAARTKNVSVPEPELLPGEAGAMNRSALALADVLKGAQAKSRAQDGLLTAEEARSLDLDGTQLVVLSACETGHGALSAGQGVYGLRRAFLVAGAETLVTSLWRVHDEATGELMALYYRKLLDKQRPGDRLGAMVETMQQLRVRPGRSHPYYWAPFIVIGQDGPLRPPP